MKRVLETFPKERILTMIFDDLESRPEWFLRQFFEYLEVDPDFVPSILHTKVGFPEGVQAADHPTEDTTLLDKGTPEEFRNELKAVFKEDIEQLEDMIQKDLSHWK